MKLQEIMRADVIQISPGECIGEAAKRMQRNSVGCLVVTVDGAIKGIITDRDLLGCISQSHDPHQCAVALHMSRPVIILSPEEDHLTAANVMWRKRIKRIPITKAGKLLGIVSLSDLAALAERDLEKLESSTLLVSNLIKTQGAQRGASKPGTVTAGGVPKPADEQRVSLGDETESIL
jgi:signal-transduction protein with cAMP-binding, CBS, and nucleotidyltransferase domain